MPIARDVRSAALLSGVLKTECMIFPTHPDGCATGELLEGPITISIGVKKYRPNTTDSAMLLATTIPKNLRMRIVAVTSGIQATTVVIAAATTGEPMR